MGSSQSTAQKDSSRSLQKAASIQDLIAQQTLEDPLFQQRQALSQQLISDPFTFGAGDRQALFQNQAALANQAANDFVDNSLASATGPSGAGARSGSVVDDRIMAASGLGQALANARQQVDLAGAQQDRADLISSLGLIDQQLSASNAPEQQRVQTNLGLGQTFAGFGPEQQGIGGLFAGAAGNALGSAVGGK